MKAKKRKRKVEDSERTANQRVYFELGKNQKKQVEIIRGGTGLSLATIARYGVGLVIERYTAGTFELRDALKHIKVAGRAKGSAKSCKGKNE